MATDIRVAKTGVKLRSGSAEASRSGIWVGVFAITMSFAALTSALFVRQGSAPDWQHIVLPPVLYANTLALLLSSLTLEMSRRTLSAGPLMESGVARRALGWLAATLGLGLVFVAGQSVVWHRLAAQGLFLATNPNCSFFYVFTGMHVLHLLAGIAALVYVIGRLAASQTTFRRSTFEAVSIYWHFMGVLWVYLLLVLRMKL
jgi:cytochrome c oxidase subunit 3